MCKKPIPIIFLIIYMSLIGCSHQQTGILIKGKSIKANLIADDQFNSGLSNWMIEQRDGGTVEISDGQMDIDDANGCTVWYKQKFEGNIVIEYDAVVLDKGGKNDRVSDLNCFWMASDTDKIDFFANSTERGGKFQNYHKLQLYYVGLGGHDNTKTRFRRYAGGGERPCLPEHDLSDKQFLITANQLNSIRLVVYNGTIQYHRNNQLIYDFKDEHPYTTGYFGIRTYKNHMLIDNFKVYQLID